ncbi:DUF1566 domain-containing protein [candidate division KSB1 bacterium]|nr:DUF1566 domain-containing protein [candidate division KSB1 bacterium]
MIGVFISHAEEDEALAIEIADCLTPLGIEVRLNHKDPSEEFRSPERIVKSINWADAFILVWTQTASESHEMMFEWTNALNLRKPIIPCLFEDIELPDSLSHTKPIIFQDRDAGFRVLEERIISIDDLQTSKATRTRKSVFSYSAPPVEKEDSRDYEAAKDVSTQPSIDHSDWDLLPERPGKSNKSKDWYKIGSLVAGALVILLLIVIIYILLSNNQSPKTIPETPGILTEQTLTREILSNRIFDSKRNSEASGYKNLFRMRIIQSDTIVVDDASGLMWQYSGISFETMTLAEARLYIQDLNERGIAGFRDWRLPTLMETMTLVEATKNELGIHSDFSSGVWQDKLLTSDKSSRSGFFWVANFAEGYCEELDEAGSAYVKAVRSN